MPRKPTKEAAPTEGQQDDPKMWLKEVTLTRAITINLGDFESMRFDLSATAEVLPRHADEQLKKFETWVTTQLEEWITSEVDPLNVPRTGPKPAGQVARYYKEKTK